MACSNPGERRLGPSLERPQTLISSYVPRMPGAPRGSRFRPRVVFQRQFSDQILGLLWVVSIKPCPNDVRVCLRSCKPRKPQSVFAWRAPLFQRIRSRVGCRPGFVMDSRLCKQYQKSLEHWSVVLNCLFGYRPCCTSGVKVFIPCCVRPPLRPCFRAGRYLCWGRTPLISNELEAAGTPGKLLVSVVEVSTPYSSAKPVQALLEPVFCFFPLCCAANAIVSTSVLPVHTFLSQVRAAFPLSARR